MAPKLPGEDRHTWDEHSLGNIWKINGKGDTRYAVGGLWQNKIEFKDLNSYLKIRELCFFKDKKIVILL